MEELRSEKPVPCPAIQFSGGEPTMHPDYFKIIRKAKELGFVQIQAATNGIKMAESLEFCQEQVDSGMSTPYLQFDGFKDGTYKKVRGKEDLLESAVSTNEINGGSENYNHQETRIKNQETSQENKEPAVPI